MMPPIPMSQVFGHEPIPQVPQVPQIPHVPQVMGNELVHQSAVPSNLSHQSVVPNNFSMGNFSYGK